MPGHSRRNHLLLVVLLSLLGALALRADDAASVSPPPAQSMLDAVRTFCRCAALGIAYTTRPESLFNYEMHRTTHPAEKLVAGMLSRLPNGNATTLRDFCARETARLSPDGERGICKGSFAVTTNFGVTTARSFSLTMCRLGWVFWGFKRTPPGIEVCHPDSPKLLWTVKPWYYDPKAGSTVPVDRGRKYTLFNQIRDLSHLTEKDRMYTTLTQHAHAVSPRCGVSVARLLPRTYVLSRTDDCRAFFDALWKGYTCGGDALGGGAGGGGQQGWCSARGSPGLTSGEMGGSHVPAGGASNETWWLMKIAVASRSIGHQLIIPSVHLPQVLAGCRNASCNVTTRLDNYGLRGERCAEVADAVAKAGDRDWMMREVVVEYVRRPFLIEGRKFHLRAYAAVVSTHPLLAFFHPAFIKVGSTVYEDDPAHRDNVLMHFTSGQGGEDHQHDVIWEYDDLDVYLSSIRGMRPAGFVRGSLVPRIQQVMVLSLRALHDRLPDGVEGMYQEFSFDFMLSEELDLILLEVNSDSGAIKVSQAFFTSLATAIASITEARQQGTWPMDEPGPLPPGIDVGSLTLLIHGDWEWGTMDGCQEDLPTEQS
eukprot:jgi/Mesvir1/7676/Mv11646-RA.1